MRTSLLSDDKLLTSAWKCQSICSMGQYGRLTVKGTGTDISAHCAGPKLILLLNSQPMNGPSLFNCNNNRFVISVQSCWVCNSEDIFSYFQILA